MSAMDRTLGILAATLALALAGPSAHAAGKAKPAAPAAKSAQAAAPAPAAFTPPANAVEVRVERIPPQREKYATLRFLKENRAWIRACYDRLKEKPVGHSGAAESVDPRFLLYQRLLAEVRSSEDSLTAAEEERKREELFASITDLGKLEAQLDVMDRLLTEQRVRLAELEQDFAGRQQTSLAIVVSGCPAGLGLDSLAIVLENNVRVSVPLSADQRAELARGGVLQIFRGLVEPREQLVQVAAQGGVGLSPAPGYLTIEPPRDRLTFLKLDLSRLQAQAGAPSMTASTWTLDSDLHANNDSPGP